MVEIPIKNSIKCRRHDLLIREKGRPDGALRRDVFLFLPKGRPDGALYGYVFLFLTDFRKTTACGDAIIESLPFPFFTLHFSFFIFHLYLGVPLRFATGRHLTGFASLGASHASPLQAAHAENVH